MVRERTMGTHQVPTDAEPNGTDQSPSAIRNDQACRDQALLLQKKVRAKLGHVAQDTAPKPIHSRLRQGDGWNQVQRESMESMSAHGEMEPKSDHALMPSVKCMSQDE